MSPLARTRCLLAAVGLALAACTPAATSRDPADAEARLQELLGDLRCSSDNACRTLAWGHKPCGGPQRWVAWSTEASDEAQLQRLARDHAQAQQIAQARDGLMSNCQLVTDPGAQCVARRCVLRPARGGGDPAAR